MDYTLYRNSLGIALTLMLFFACYFIAGKTPDKPIFDNYRRSRRIMGIALLLLSANYSVHLFAGLRFNCQDAAILMNLSTYFLAYWLFSAALITLLNRSYITTRRTVRNIAYWLAVNILSCIIVFAFPDGLIRHLGTIALAAWLFVYGICLSRRIIKTYHNAVRIFDDTHSEDIAAYIRWMSIFTWWAIIYGVSCGLLTFLPDEFVFLWILSSVPFYIFLFYSYMNYLLFYEQVETILENTPREDVNCAGNATAELPANEEAGIQTAGTPSYYTNIRRKLNDWIAQHGYTSPGLTVEELAKQLDSNRTYVSSYIKQTYGMTFREWIASLRIEYAKQILTDNSRMPVNEVCEATGFISNSYFVRIFTKSEGVSPLKWRKQHGSINKK